MLWNKYKKQTKQKQSVQNEWNFLLKMVEYFLSCLFCHQERALGVPENAQIGSEFTLSVNEEIDMFLRAV